MSQLSLNPRKIVVLSGAGISAPSGLATFRDAGGIWSKYRIEDVATPEAWAKNPGLVLEFYNARRAQAAAALPNDGHRAIAALESRFEVVVITQNVDDLHERGGSNRVIHLHGELSKARSTIDPLLIQEIGGAPIRLGDRCRRGGQLRPHIVWFGEEIHRFGEAVEEIRSAGRVLVVGTSLAVFPAAGLVKFARADAEKVLVDLDASNAPSGFRPLRGSADKVLPALANQWLGDPAQSSTRSDIEFQQSQQKPQALPARETNGESVGRRGTEA
ncbi:MAG TPA: Sir2 family NAD-dependent protein deacetylase [Lacunisphaera sp.]|nr:Sir2 family NAD-dependent protein deacetylase [Lacunisphaera sp.]